MVSVSFENFFRLQTRSCIKCTWERTRINITGHTDENNNCSAVFLNNALCVKTESTWGEGSDSSGEFETMLLPRASQFITLAQTSLITPEITTVQLWAHFNTIHLESVGFRKKGDGWKWSRYLDAIRTASCWPGRNTWFWQMGVCYGGSVRLFHLIKDIQGLL